jgi:hypothetical protein
MPGHGLVWNHLHARVLVLPFASVCTLQQLMGQHRTAHGCLSCRYNISCYSSLLQQVDATADAELVFQQQATNSAAAQAALGPYGAVWMHPDDLQHLQQLQGQGTFAGGSGAVAQGARTSVVGSGAARYAQKNGSAVCLLHWQQSSGNLGRCVWGCVTG